MSLSYRSEPERNMAIRHFNRNLERIDRNLMCGYPVFPRVIERSPCPGDIHPLRVRDIHHTLQRLPYRYVSGLSLIELRARESEAIGKPYGCYRPGEKSILLYSVPAGDWHFPLKLRSHADILHRSYDAEIEISNGGVLVRWPDPVDLWRFRLFDVLLHEFGHHFHNQYRTKNKYPGSYSAEESSARRLARMLEKELTGNKGYRF